MKAVEGAESEVLNGVMISKERLTRQMPLELEGNIKVMVLDDALEQESLENGALSTESGFQQYLVLKEEFKTNHTETDKDRCAGCVCRPGRG